MAILYSGTEGTCQWTIDDQGHLYIGDGVINHTTRSSNDWGWFRYSDKIKTVSSGNISWALGTNAFGMFYGCQSLTSLDVSNFNTNNVTSMRAMFNDCRILTSLDLSNFDTSNVTEMTYMFTNCIFLTSLDVSNFDTSNVTDMSGMFSGCSSLTSLNLSSFDTSKVENMILMFSDCQSLTSLNLSNFNTSSVTNMGSMFSDCHSLTSLNLSNFNTSKVTEMANMFNNCYSLISLDLSSFDTSNVTTMRYMFFRCSLLTAIIVSNKWAVASVTSSSNMFTNCNSLIGEQGTIYNSSHTDASYAYIDGGTSNPGYLIDINSCSCYASFNSDNKELRIFMDAEGRYTEGQVIGSTTYWTDIENITGQNAPPWYENFSQDIESVKIINTYKPKTAYWLFNGCFSLASLDLSNLDTSNVTNMSGMFLGCELLTSLDLSKFDTSNITDMSLMFIDCDSLTSLDLSNFNTSKVTDMSYMFASCDSLTSLNLSNFDTSNVTNMRNMFSECLLLTSLNLSNFNTSKVENMQAMFENCGSLTSLDLSNFNTSNVTNMRDMFSACRSLTSLNLSNFDTHQVENMRAMFEYCWLLASLDLSSFNTSNVTDMVGMFNACHSLTSLDLSNFDTSKVTNMGGMFYECYSLTSLNLLSFDTSSVTNMGSMFVNCSSLTSLDLLSFDTHQVESMSRMFYGCINLTTITMSSGFKTSKIENMTSMFHSCQSLTSLNLSSFDTSKVTTMDNMFYDCESLTSLNLSSFDTSKVTNMSFMFANCINLISLNLPEDFASNTINFNGVFGLDAKLTQLNITKMHLEKVDQLSIAFKKCPFSLNLVVGNVNLTSYTSAFEDSTGTFYIIDPTKSNTSWQTVASEYSNVFYNADGAFLPAYRLNAVRGSILDDVWTNDEGGDSVQFTYNAGDITLVSNIPEGFSCTSNTTVDVKENNIVISDEWTWENNTYILELQELSKAHQYVMELTYNFIDEDGNTYTKTVSQLISIAEPYALLDFRAGGKGIAVGKLSERNGFDIAFPVSIGEGLIPPGEWSYFQSKDTKVNDSKTYYTYDEQTGEYNEVSNPTTESPVEQGYYEREWSIDLKNYQLLVGDYNVLNEDAYMVVGGGSDDEHRRNILELDTAGLRVYAFDGTTQIANLGYGSGIDSSGGTNNAPYYTFGIRMTAINQYDPNETYDAGDLCVYNDGDGNKIYVCYNNITIPEQWDANHWNYYIGNYSMTEGYLSTASGFASHAEGNKSKAFGAYSHAEGYSTLARGVAHAEGYSTQALGHTAHSEGNYTKALGIASHAQNQWTIANEDYQTVIGKFNDNQTDTALEIGNGEYGARSNAFTVDWNGNVMAQGFAGMIQMTAIPAGGPGSNILVPADNTTIYEPISGWLICNGASVSALEYPELFNAIKYTYGGSGNNFNLPDLRGRFPIGGGTGTAADATAHTLNQKNGREKVTLGAANMPYHRHGIPKLSMSTYDGFKPSLQVCSVTTGSSSTSDNPIIYANESRGTANKNNAYTGASNVGGIHTHTTNANNTDYAGGSNGAATAHENMPPYIGINFIIATGKTS